MNILHYILNIRYKILNIYIYRQQNQTCLPWTETSRIIHMREEMQACILLDVWSRQDHVSFPSTFQFRLPVVNFGNVLDQAALQYISHLHHSLSVLVVPTISWKVSRPFAQSRKENVRIEKLELAMPYICIYTAYWLVMFVLLQMIQQVETGSNSTNYFASSDPRLDNFFCHNFRRIIWQYMWPTSSDILFWHSVWHLFWHLTWHLFRHLF